MVAVTNAEIARQRGLVDLIVKRSLKQSQWKERAQQDFVKSIIVISKELFREILQHSLYNVLSLQYKPFLEYPEETKTVSNLSLSS